MIFSNLLIGVYVLILVGNGYMWYRYNKKASQDQRKKEGWSRYYLLATVFVLVLLSRKIGL